MPARFRKFNQQIYAGGEPSAKDLEYMRNILGVKTVLSLDGTVANKIAPFLKSLKIEQISVPIDASSSVINEQIRFLQRNIVRILSTKQPIYVHCLYGRDRTGLALMLYRVLKDRWPYTQAVAEAKKYGYGQGLSPQTQKLWEKFLLALNIDSNATQDDDIVGYMRDIFNIGNVPPAFNPMQSFAPRSDSDISPSLYHNVDRYERAKIRNKNWEEILNDKIPIVGQPTMLGPIAGYGPVENSSGVISLL